MLNRGFRGSERSTQVPFAATVFAGVLAIVAATLVGVVAPTSAEAAVPASVSVVVSGDALAGLTLKSLKVTPTFASDIRDYSVRCHGGVNLLTLTLTATTGGSIAVDGASGHVLRLPETLVENQALVVRATDPASPSGPPAEYWIRCLPHDFPQLSVIDGGTTPPGWYLTGNLTKTSTSGFYAMILDEHGTPVWYRPAPGGAINTVLLAGNTIAWAPSLGPGFGTDPDGAYTLFHPETGTTSFLSAPAPPMDAHELLELGDGHHLFIATPLRSGVDLSELGSEFATTDTVVDCVVEETDADGMLVWQWRMSDHVGVNEALTTPRLANSPSTVDGTSAADIYHCNSLAVDPGGNVLISSRNTNALYLVDRVTGGIDWKMGGTASNLDDAQILTIQNDPETTFSGQHDARFRPDGNISLFDDHTGASGAAREWSTRSTPTRTPRRSRGSSRLRTGFRARPRGASAGPPTGTTTSSGGGSRRTWDSPRSTRPETSCSTSGSRTASTRTAW